VVNVASTRRGKHVRLKLKKKGDVAEPKDSGIGRDEHETKLTTFSKDAKKKAVIP